MTAKAATTLALVLIGVGIVLRLGFLGTDSLWLDEAYSVVVVQDHSLREAWETVLDSDHPPLSFVILRLTFLALGASETTARLPSALASVCSLGLIFVLARRLGMTKERWPVGSAAARAGTRRDLVRAGGADVRAGDDDRAPLRDWSGDGFAGRGGAGGDRPGRGPLCRLHHGAAVGGVDGGVAGPMVASGTAAVVAGSRDRRHVNCLVVLSTAMDAPVGSPRPD